MPTATEGGDAVAYVSGQTAAFKDIGDRIMERAPLFLLYIIGVTFIVLAMAFRSIVVSLTAAVTTILSAFVGFGVLTLVVQEGHLLGLTGLDRTGPIETFIPPIAFAILFGLSMDYMVFLMSRIREEHVHGLQTRAAIEHGIAAIGRVVVAAAIIMGTVFAAFILSGDRVSKEFGILLAVAILVDALVMRMTLVPAFFTLLGEKTWYIPTLARPAAAEHHGRGAARGRGPWRHRAEAGRGDGRVVGTTRGARLRPGTAPLRSGTRARGTPRPGAGGTARSPSPSGRTARATPGRAANDAQRVVPPALAAIELRAELVAERADRVAPAIPCSGRPGRARRGGRSSLNRHVPSTRGPRCRARGPACRSRSPSGETAPRDSRTSREAPVGAVPEVPHRDRLAGPARA